jgi:hypothetical protein
MSELIVKAVYPNNFHQTWPLVEQLFAKAIKYAGDEYTLDQIKALLAQGNWLLLVAVDDQNEIHGAASINFMNMLNDRIAFITALAGKAVVNKDIFKQVCDIAKVNGATKIQCAARESAAKLYKQIGMKERHIILEATL